MQTYWRLRVCLWITYGHAILNSIAPRILPLMALALVVGISIQIDQNFEGVTETRLTR